MSENTQWTNKMPDPPPPAPAYQTSRMSAPQKTVEKIKLDLDELRGEVAALKRTVIALELKAKERDAAPDAAMAQTVSRKNKVSEV